MSAKEADHGYHHDPNSVDSVLSRIDANVQILKENQKEFWREMAELKRSCEQNKHSIHFIRGNAFAISALTGTIISLVAIFWKH